MLTERSNKFLGVLAVVGALGVFGTSRVEASPIDLAVTLRDFCGIGYTCPAGWTAHNDFERAMGVDDRGIAGAFGAAIGGDQKPVYAFGTNPSTFGTVTDADHFNQFYNTDTSPGVKVNKEVPFTLTFQDIGGGLFQYSNPNYFPLNGLAGALGDTNVVALGNFAFTTEIHSTFVYRPGLTFKFEGDDDVWLYLNNKLALDLGGVHQSETAFISLDDPIFAPFNFQNNQVYNFDFFGAERHTVQSSVIITTNLFGGQENPVPEPTTLVILGSGLATAIARRRKKSAKA